jgi:methionyl-tRNA formyltransferase
VVETALSRGIDVTLPEDVNQHAFVQRVARIAPDFIFSFYYRQMLGVHVLDLARRGAFNMHGSLLPRYRGRAPVNWAILNGETETGATLHYMVARPDAGPIVAQERVPIGRDDTALGVSLAVAEAAAHLLARALPVLASGPPTGRVMDVAAGSYFGGRTPEDGRIDWALPAARVHDLIRAVAPPFPGAFTDIAGRRAVFSGSRWTGEPARHRDGVPCLYAEGEGLFLDCADGVRLAIPGLLLDGAPVDAEALRGLHGEAPVRLASSNF